MAELLSQVFKKNRAEEFPDDLWGNFVLPINYQQYNLLIDTKGVKVEGGRGTGKTMFLKYHCFPTQLSPKRTQIDESALNNIGIYWRPDTHFVQLINENYLGPRWGAVFNTYVGLSLLMKFSQFIQQLITSNYDDEPLKKALSELQIPTVLQEELKIDYSILYVDLYEHCFGQLYKMQNWLHSPLTNPPLTIDGKGTLVFAIKSIISRQLLTDTSYHIFIDEFENLRAEQQIIINDWMKHGEKPLLFSIAYKKYAHISDKTSGKETTQRRNDHRIIDLVDDVYAKSEQEFKVFASEIIASKLQEFFKTEKIMDTTIISDVDKLSIRREPSYQRNMLKTSNITFPELTYKEIAEHILSDKILFDRVKRNISQALRNKSTKLQEEDFIDKEFADATLVNSILLYRVKTDPKDLHLAFNIYKQDIYSKKIAQYKEQIKNNIVGSILYIYSSYPQRICPVYGGFNRFCAMSRSNLRHLLELCYQSFVELESHIQLDPLKDKFPVVPLEDQLKSAKFCSKQELETLSELGPYGQSLQKIANRLGRIFYLKQKIRTQSKPENIHFSVETENLNYIDEKIKTLLEEAKIWNVLQVHASTKGTEDNISSEEYMLSPMLAPYYKITTRKIHKVVFSVANLRTIFLDDDDNFDTYYEQLIKEWKIDDQPGEGLFGDLF